MGLSQSTDTRLEEEEEEEDEDEEDDDVEEDGEEEKEEEKEEEEVEKENGSQGTGGRGNGSGGDHRNGVVGTRVKVAQEPEMRPFEASTSPLTPQNPIAAGGGLPGFQSGFGPSIRVWDPGHVLTPPHSLPPKPGPLPPPHLDRRLVDAHPDTCFHIYLIRHAESNMNTSPSLIGGRSPSATLTVEGKRQARALGVFLLSQGVHFDSVFSSPLERCKRTAVSVCQELNFPEQKMEFSESLIEMSQGDWEGLRRSEVYTGEVLHKMGNSQLDFRAPGGESQRQVEFRMVEFFNNLVLPKPFFHKDGLIRRTDEMDKIKMPTASSSNDSSSGSSGSSKGAYLAKTGGSNKSRLQISKTADSNGNADSSSESNGTRVFASKTIYFGVFSHGMAIKCLLRGLLGSNPNTTHKICIDNTSVTLLKYSSSDGWQILRVNDMAHLRVI